MTIKFIKNCQARQVILVTRCSCCGPERDWDDVDFFVGEEVDTDVEMPNIDISKLKYNEDYIITQIHPPLPSRDRDN